MKKIVHTGDAGDLAMVQSLLEAEAIEFEVRNNPFPGILTGLGPTRFWIKNDTQFDKAQSIIQHYYQQKGKPAKRDIFYWLRIGLGFLLLLALLLIIYSFFR